MENKEQQGVEAGGFCFMNGEDAALADKEQKQIEYLETRLNFQHPEQILAIYGKLVEERTFKTPVGMSYLKRLQDYLLSKPSISREKIPFIPVAESYVRKMPETRVELKSIKEAAQRKRDRKASNYKISIALNVILVIGILVMFWMTMQSATPNMLNYKTALENQYATWEQELTERENVVREKEREFEIQDK